VGIKGGGAALVWSRLLMNVRRSSSTRWIQHPWLLPASSFDSPRGATLCGRVLALNTAGRTLEAIASDGHIHGIRLQAAGRRARHPPCETADADGCSPHQVLACSLGAHCTRWLAARLDGMVEPLPEPTSSTLGVAGQPLNSARRGWLLVALAASGKADPV